MRISIIGLGWLGQALALSLRNKGHQVIGSTTSLEKIPSLAQEGIKVLQFKLDPHPIGVEFQKLFDTEIVIITIPPKSKHQTSEFYLEQLNNLRDLIKTAAIKKVIFISSTGIYPKQTKLGKYSATEKITLETTGNPVLFEAEAIFQNNTIFETTIIRFGGLMGSDRIPINYFTNKENVDGETRVNYIHQSDAVRLIEWIVNKNIWNCTIDGVAPIHPKKREILESNAKKLGVPPPKSYESSSKDDQRLIDSTTALETGFQFDFPNPLDFTYHRRLN